MVQVGEGKIRGGKGTVRTGEGTIRTGLKLIFKWRNTKMDLSLMLFIRELIYLTEG